MPFIRNFSLALLVFCILLKCVFGNPENQRVRKEILLNGIWKLKVKGEDKPQDVIVPGSFAGQDHLWGKDYWDVWGYPKEWHNKSAVYTRQFNIEGKNVGERVWIRFGGVRHIFSVEVNGAEIGTWRNSYVPSYFDVTDKIKNGVNEISVNITDDKDCGLFEDFNSFRRGIYRDVLLQFVPEISVTPDLFLQTSVAQNRVSCQIPVRNGSSASETVHLKLSITNPKGEKVCEWASEETVSIPPGQTMTIKTDREWKNPHLWGLDDPYLYHLNTEVVNAQQVTLDRHRLRFGFREITWKNQHLFLNGHELFLRGDGAHPQGDLQEGVEYCRAWIKKLKSQDVEIMRMHDLPRSEDIYAAGDELGFLFISEAAHHFRLPPKDLAMQNMELQVKWLRNHPSVALWSVSNELHWRNFEEPVYLIDLCHQLDPTRPAFASDFCKYSIHGDVLSKHYSPETVWSDWNTCGPDKPMVWDEIGAIWQRDRPLKTGPAGFEVSSQDVATGIWRDGWEQMRKDIEIFASGKTLDDKFYRVNVFIPWDFSYVFYRFLPFNNFQKIYPKYNPDVRGIQPKFIQPCATTTNIWDPTLPESQPNPGLYCFDEYLKKVRFPDEKKERTFFSEDVIKRQSRLFFEDHRPADLIKFLVESPDGKILTSSEKACDLKPGELVTQFDSTWKMPKVDAPTPVKLVREFSYQGKVGYRKIDEVKIFPRPRPIDLESLKISVVDTRLQKILQGKGVPIEQAKIILAETFQPSWEKLVSQGVRVLIQPITEVKEHPQENLNLIFRGNSQISEDPFDKKQILDEALLSFGTPDKASLQLTGRGLQFNKPLSGSWVAIHFNGSMDFTKKSDISISYGLWSDPRPEEYETQWNRLGGAPFFKKSVRLMILDSKGNWFLSGKEDSKFLERNKPKTFKGLLVFDVSLMHWEPVRLEKTKATKESKKNIPDLTAVSGVALLLEESNPACPMQISDLQINASCGPHAFLQPGGVVHTLLKNLGQEDFTFWRGGSSTFLFDLPKNKNVRRILFGNKDGSGSALQETFIGNGVVLESALNIQNQEEPVAGFLLNRMIDYLLSYKPMESTREIAFLGNMDLEEWLKNLGADVKHADNEPTFSLSDIVWVDARDFKSLMKNKNSLISHLSKGGVVVFSQVTDESIATVKEICSLPLRLTEPFFEQRYHCIKAPVSWGRVGSPLQWVDYYDGILVPYPFEPNLNPLLAGIANFDLNWGKIPMFQKGIEVEGMNPVTRDPSMQILISNWHIGDEPCNDLYGESINGVRDLRQNSWFVNRDPVLMELKVKKGKVLISQLDLMTGQDKSKRVMQTLLTNLRISFGGAKPAPAEIAYPNPLFEDQLNRFLVYNSQIQPVRREYYGIPNPMPEYLKGTSILGSPSETKLPTLGFFADALTLVLANPVGKKLENTLKLETSGALGLSDQAVAELQKLMGETKYDRIVFSLGEADLDQGLISKEKYQKHLMDVWKLLSNQTQQLFWMPIPSAFGPDQSRASKAQELNEIADHFFEGKDVYKIPFVYNKTDEFKSGYFSGKTKKFNNEEVKTIAERVAEAVKSFGAQ